MGQRKIGFSLLTTRTQGLSDFSLCCHAQVLFRLCPLGVPRLRAHPGVDEPVPSLRQPLGTHAVLGKDRGRRLHTLFAHLVHRPVVVVVFMTIMFVLSFSLQPYTARVEGNDRGFGSRSAHFEGPLANQDVWLQARTCDSASTLLDNFHTSIHHIQICPRPQW